KQPVSSDEPVHNSESQSASAIRAPQEKPDYKSSLHRAALGRPQSAAEPAVATQSSALPPNISENSQTKPTVQSNCKAARLAFQDAASPRATLRQRPYCMPNY